MKITKIEQQKKRPDRYSVYVNDEFAFGLGESDILRLDLRKGQEISSKELEELENEAEFGKAYDRALSYLDIRPRSSKEIRDYLKRKDYPSSVVSNVLDKLEGAGLVDDMQFARVWVQWRTNAKPRSRLRLIQELKKKGLDNETIDAAIEDIDDETEIQQVEDLIAKHGRRYNSRQKLMAYLSRQGYHYDIIRQALERE